MSLLVIQTDQHDNFKETKRLHLQKQFILTDEGK